MLKVRTNYNDIECDILFEDKVNLFKGCSGEGKTFVFRIIKTYLKYNGVSCLFVGNEMMDLSEEELILLCRGKSVIIFDKADLYLTQRLLDYAVQEAETIIVSMKCFFGLNFCKLGMYTIDYQGNSLSTKRRVR